MNVTLVAQLASAVAVVVAVIFGTLQIRQMRKTRALFALAELVRSMQTPEFTRSVRMVLALPDRADPSAIRDDNEMATAVFAVSHVFESLGVLVFHRIVHINLVDDLMGGYVRVSWMKLAPYVEAQRLEIGGYYGEWMQWLAERLLEHPSEGKVRGAHVAHRLWRP